MDMMISTHVEASKIGRQVVDQVIDSKIDQADSMSGLSNGEVNVVKHALNCSNLVFCRIKFLPVTVIYPLTLQSSRITVWMS